MLRFRNGGGLVAALLAAALSVGCASESERPENNVPPPRRPAPLPEPVPAGFTPLPVVAPVTQWRRALREVIPAGWSIGDAQDQIVEPLGWQRRFGDRGLRFDVYDPKGAVRFVATLMPADFDGVSLELGLAFADGKMEKRGDPSATGEPVERFHGRVGDFLLFVWNDCGKDWEKSVDDVAKALGAKK